MNKITIYIHGQGGSPEEAEHYRPLFKDCNMVGFDYTAQSPWEAKEKFPKFFDSICGLNKRKKNASGSMQDREKVIY